MSENETLSFEEALIKLENIVRELESGRIKLDDAVAAYTQAVNLKKFCEQRLKDARLQIEKIEASPDGEIKTVPFNPAEEQA